MVRQQSRETPRSSNTRLSGGKRRMIKKARAMARQCKGVFLLIVDAEADQVVTYNSDPTGFTVDKISTMISDHTTYHRESYNDTHRALIDSRHCQN